MSGSEVSVEAPLVLVTVGTDYHPFPRLAGWVVRWLEEEKSLVRCVFQGGTTPAVSVGEWRAFLSYQEMERLLRRARVVVSHGGPGTIMMTLATGKRPIVVPRLRRHGEHVDDHQLAFARRLAREGDIEIAESFSEFRASLAAALAGPEQPQAASVAASGPAISRVEELVERVLHSR